jgi:hypothetical protein
MVLHHTPNRRRGRDPAKMPARLLAGPGSSPTDPAATHPGLVYSTCRKGRLSRSWPWMTQNGCGRRDAGHAAGQDPDLSWIPPPWPWPSSWTFEPNSAGSHDANIRSADTHTALGRTNPKESERIQRIRTKKRIGASQELAWAYSNSAKPARRPNESRPRPNESNEFCHPLLEPSRSPRRTQRRQRAFAFGPRQLESQLQPVRFANRTGVGVLSSAGPPCPLHVVLESVFSRLSF